MTMLDLRSGDLLDDGGRGLSFFDWILRVHVSLHNARTLRARYRRRAHLPVGDWPQPAPRRAPADATDRT